ncbi:MAG: TolC family protein [Bacteroidetes bacterium]|nr:TolC family protein [Bacteroidota bacterium]
MNKIVLMAICGCLFSTGLLGRNDDWSKMFTEIAQNNKQLKAYGPYLESRKLSNETFNNLDDLQFSGAWLPLGNNSTPDYMEFQLSQSFEFPSAYKARSQYMEQDNLQQEVAYQKDKQVVLAEAFNICTQLTYQQKRRTLEEERSEQARKVYEQIQELYDKEQVGKLDLNKAKVAWLQQQFSTRQIDSDIESLLLNLKSLNGGQEMTFSSEDYESRLALLSLDSLWQQKLKTDPTLRYLAESEKTALANIRVQKKERLPEFDLGLNFEGFKGENYAGFSGGLSIPVWNRRNTVKAAEAHYLFEQAHTNVVTGDIFGEFESDYHQYNYLLHKYNAYQAALESLDSEFLLSKAYELGQLSYLEYYMELKFYQDAIDELLKMEQQLHLLKNQLLKHNL